MKQKQPLCEQCKSAFVYVTSKETVCRRCGHRTKNKTKSKGGGGKEWIK